MEVLCHSAPAADPDSVSFFSASFESPDWTSLCNMDSGSFEGLSEFLEEEEQKHPGSCLKKGSMSARKYAVLAEQGRRKRMKTLSAQLSSVLPNASAQTNRVRLYEAAMTHIKGLEGQIKQLTAKKNSLLKMHGHQKSSETTTTTATDSTMVNIFIFGREVSITVNSPRKPRSASKLLQAVENQNLDIDSFQMFSWDFEVSCSFRAFLREEDSTRDLTQTRNLLEELLKRVY